MELGSGGERFSGDTVFSVSISALRGRSAGLHLIHGHGPDSVALIFA